MKGLKDKLRGFTLADSLASMVVVVLLVATFFSFYAWINNYMFSFFQSSDQASIELQQVNLIRDEFVNAQFIEYNPHREELTFFGDVKRRIRLAQGLLEIHSENETTDYSEPSTITINQMHTIYWNNTLIIERLALNTGNENYPVLEFFKNHDATTLYSLQNSAER